MEKDIRFHPLLKAIMRGRMRTQLGLVQGLPVAAGSQDVEDRVDTVSIRHARSSSAKAMGVDMHGQQGLEHCP
jgi:hypothetical protein